MNAKFKVTYTINGVIVTNFIKPETEDLYFLYLVQTAVADEWTRKLLEKDKSYFAKLVCIEQVE